MSEVICVLTFLLLWLLLLADLAGLGGLSRQRCGLLSRLGQVAGDEVEHQISLKQQQKHYINN